MTETNAKEPAKIAVSKLIELARQGRKEALPVLKRVLDEHPDLWRDFGNLACQAQSYWVELIGDKDLYVKESMARYAAELRAELAGSDSTPLERLQIERIVALSLQVGFLEILVAKYEKLGPEKIVAHLYERAGVADRRLQEAILNLARVRKLLPRVLRVDVVLSGEVQANIHEAKSGGEEDQSSRPARISVPENRIRDLLSAASN